MSVLGRHPDAILASGLALVLSAEALTFDTSSTGLALGSALLAGGALGLRRTWPLVAFALTAAGLTGVILLAPGLDGESVGFILIYFIAHYSLGRWTTGVQAWSGAVFVLLSTVAFAVGDARQNDTNLSEVGLGDVAFILGFVGGPWAAGLAIRLRRAREVALDLENRQLHADQEAKARRAVAEERARIARELHDVVSHAISVTVLQARGARATLGRDEAAVRRSLDAIEQTNTAALSDMRRLLAVLRETEGDDADGSGADPHAPLPSLTHLDSLVAHVRASGVPVEVEVRGPRHAVPPGVDLTAYRIVQEALTNVLKHAGPATARVSVTYEAEAVDVRVWDDGSGGEAIRSGNGLIGIRERAAVVGGTVTLGPGPVGGFQVAARLPYSLESS